MAAITICSDFGAQENKICHCFHCFPVYLQWSDGTRCDDLSFLNIEFWASFFTFLFHFHQEALCFLFTFCHKNGVICLSEQSLPAILIPAYASFTPAFRMMYSVYKLNKQDNNIQPWRSPFPILSQSIVPCPVLIVASWLAYRFHRRQVRWSGIAISWRIFQFVVVYTAKGFSVVSEVEVDVFLEFFSFYYDPMDVGNLISGSSAFSKSSLYIWKFSVHIPLKPSLKDFEQLLC